MSGNRFRTSLFGFNKSDVYNYIREVDENTGKKLADKDAEIADLKREVKTLTEQRESIVNVLQLAERNARDIVDSAKKDAEELRSSADKEINEKKVLLNREIEIKKREIENNYISETKKISQIREEVALMRRKSIEAIKKFESELMLIENSTDAHASLIDTILENHNMSGMPEPFEDAVRSISVHSVNQSEDSIDTI